MDYQKEILKFVNDLGITDRKASEMCGISYRTYRWNKTKKKLTKKHYDNFVNQTKLFVYLCNQIIKT